MHVPAYDVAGYSDSQGRLSVSRKGSHRPANR
jgi:hypothetical protein